MRSLIADNKIVATIFAAALLLRVVNLNIPFLEPFNNYSRQSMCASVTRNYYEHGFRLFYPEIDESGAGPSLYNVELPTHSYLMALAYKLVGGVKEWAARSVSVAFGMGLLLFVYLLVRRAEDELTARWALLFLSLSPMTVALSRSIQPDITMLFAGTAAVHFFYRYTETKKTAFYISSALFLFWAVLTRVFALYFFLPVLYLAWREEGGRLFRRPRYYAYALFVSLALIWYAQMWQAGRAQPLAYDPYRYTTAAGSWTLPAKSVFLHLLTLTGSALCLLGLAVPGRGRRFMMAWLASTLFYLAVLWKTALIHPYYFLPLGPPLAYFIGRGIERVRSGFGICRFFCHPLIVAGIALFFAVNNSYYYRLLYFVPADRMAVVRAGQAVDRAAPKNALVVAAYHTSPIQLYYTYRHGWALDLEEGGETETIKRIEGYRAAGAAYFVTTELDTLLRKPELTAYLDGFPRVEEDPGYRVWAIGEQRP